MNRSKSRLAPVLDGKQRAALSRQMLAHTLETLTQVQKIAGVLVVSRDTAALALAREYNIYTVRESGAPELNDALTRATEMLIVEHHANGVLVLPSDLPLLQKTDLEEMIARAQFPPVVVLAPDRRRDGTNALLIRPPGRIAYAFGVGSFERHAMLARMAEARVEVVESPTLALDVDVPEDLDLYRTMLQERDLGEPVWLSSVPDS
jgi:2-phospho-L-lactate guanylyltransferase